MPISRQESISNSIESLSVGQSITLKLFPKELTRFKAEYDCCTFDILDTTKGNNCKYHLVKITK